jgi:glucosamine-6-phosphate deaminase
MEIIISECKAEMAREAAERAGEYLSRTISHRGSVTFVAATGASQFEFLDFLTTIPYIEWSKSIMFHLDEYIGLLPSHPASFRHYLQDRLVDKVHPGKVFLIQGDAQNLEVEITRLNSLISENTPDVAFVGIGENGHLAFNDPPADFDIQDPYIVVKLDEVCRKQQLGEGWFSTLENVPTQAVSMSIKQIMKAKTIICTVPDQRKAQAVHDCMTGDINPCHPASILRLHPDAYLFLDRNSASLL